MIDLVGTTSDGAIIATDFEKRTNDGAVNRSKSVIGRQKCSGPSGGVVTKAAASEQL
jgi:hypothetical protein